MDIYRTALARLRLGVSPFKAHRIRYSPERISTRVVVVMVVVVTQPDRLPTRARGESPA